MEMNTILAVQGSIKNSLYVKQGIYIKWYSSGAFN